MNKRWSAVLAMVLAAAWVSGDALAAKRKSKQPVAPPPPAQPAQPLPPFRLPHVFSDNMVLQRDLPLPVWGWANPGQDVKVALAGASATATADKDGKWSVKLPAMKAGGPHEMTVTAGEAAPISVKNILVGEVWICSGQSNMEWAVANSDGAREEIPAANWPEIRLLQVPKIQANQPAPDQGASWQVCSPATVPGFSAVAYFFGRELHRELKVPIGMINASWGGSAIQPWTPAAGCALVDAYKAGKVAQGGAPGMYNAMVAPLVPYGIRGGLWYQGETNVHEGPIYQDRMKALILGWRQAWAQGPFPFYYVQLAPYAPYAPKLPALWEAQLKTLAVPGTGMAVITDLVGNLRDIHPRNKIDVAKRLARWALAKDYGRDLVYSGPLYKSMEVLGNIAILKFDSAGGGLASRDEQPLTHFQIAGADQKFVPAVAKILGDKIEVSAEGVPAPAAVRFAWDGTANPNLVNKEGLPASPFRTDSW